LAVSEHHAVEIVTDHRIKAIALSDFGDPLTVARPDSIQSFAVPFTDDEPIARSIELPLMGGTGEAIKWAPAEPGSRTRERRRCGSSTECTT